MKQPMALSLESGTDRGYSQHTTADYIEQMLGRDGLSSAIFPDEEIERAHLIALILKNKRKA